jgi:hypothetical protein
LPALSGAGSLEGVPSASYNAIGCAGPDWCLVLGAGDVGETAVASWAKAATSLSLERSGATPSRQEGTPRSCRRASSLGAATGDPLRRGPFRRQHVRANAAHSERTLQP